MTPPSPRSLPDRPLSASRHETADALAPWDFALPDSAIARRPAERRSASRLMHLPRGEGQPAHRVFADLPGLLRAGDLVVGNDTRVMPCRLRARRSTGGRVELLVLEPGPGPVTAMVRPLRRLTEGESLTLECGGVARLVQRLPDGLARLEFDRDPLQLMEEAGAMPLPPYLDRPADAADRERYQTVFAGPPGAAAAPTAGLHFDADLLAGLAARGVGFCTLTLHVGIGTFRPLRPEDVERGHLHSERYTVPEATATRIAQTRADGGRIIAVGTTTARTLESATPDGARAPEPGEGQTTLFIQPPYAFKALDGLITNFHLPRSSLLMLVASLVGRERLLAAYAEAVERGYRFYSYGDAMLVL